MSKQKEPKYCLWCNELLDPEWAGSQAIYCNRKCANAYWYDRKLKPHHRKIYAQAKKDWKRSKVGKKEGLSMYKWWKMPKYWRSDI